MSEIGDDFRAMREESRRHRTDKQEWSKELLDEWCEANKATLTEIQPWHLRITKDEIRLDIYPQRQRACLLRSNTWMSYKDMFHLLNKTFNQNASKTSLNNAR